MIMFYYLPNDNTVISYEFGYDYNYGKDTWHNGVDIKAKIKGVGGDPIYSVADGVVKVAQNSASFGLYIVVEHAGFCTLYAHLQNLIAMVGNTVVAGQMIGKMGSTGVSTGVHLHFEVRECPYSKFWDSSRQLPGYGGLKVNVPTYVRNPKPYILDVMYNGGLLPAINAYGISNIADFNMSGFDSLSGQKKLPSPIISTGIEAMFESAPKRDENDIDNLTGIIIHSTGSGLLQSPQSLHNQHKLSYDGLGAAFNYYVRKDGTSYALRPLKTVTCDIVGGNDRKISVCYEGDFQRESLSQTQWDAGVRLLAYLCDAKNIMPDEIDGHHKYGDAICPGSYIKTNLNNIINDVKGILAQFNSLNLVNANTSIYEPTPFYYTEDTIYYTVLAGDDINSIAKKFNTTPEVILRLNSHIATASSLMPGVKIKVPNTDYNKFNTAADSTLEIANMFINISNYSEKIAFKDSVLANNLSIINFEHQDEIDLDEIGNKKMGWMQNSFKLPGYAPCCLIIDFPNNIRKVIPFLISPSNMTDSRSNGVQTNKTSSGWFIYRLGPNLGELNISGYMLDTKHEMERHSFLQDYKMYVVDKRTESNDIVNENVVSIMIEGTLYTGIITNLTFSKSANQQFLYQYSIRFISFSDRAIYGQEEKSIFSLIGTNRQIAPTSAIVTESIVNIIDSNQTNSERIIQSAATAATATGGKTHTVVKGDTLSRIARTYGCTLQQILDLNPKFNSNPNSIFPGQVVILPATGGISSKTTTTTSTSSGATSSTSTYGGNRGSTTIN